MPMLRRKNSARRFRSNGLCSCCTSGHRVVAGSCQRMAAHQALEGEPTASDDSSCFDGLHGVVRARRKEPAGRRKVRRHDQLVSAKKKECESLHVITWWAPARLLGAPGRVERATRRAPRALQPAVALDSPGPLPEGAAPAGRHAAHRSLVAGAVGSSRESAAARGCDALRRRPCARW